MELEKALEIACKAHKGQKDKTGESYILHPINVMLKLKDKHERVVALLHDVLEDTNYQIEDLVREGLDEEEQEALLLLTKPCGMEYMDYIKNINSNKIAKAVKMADLTHNMDINRLPTRQYKRWFERNLLPKYQKAYEYLRNN